MPDPERVKAILADPEKRKAIDPGVLWLLEHHLESQKPDATAIGDTQERRQINGAKTPVSQLLYDTFNPMEGASGLDHTKDYMERVGKHILGIPQKPYQARGMTTPEAEDAWRMFLGMPQKYGAWQPSVYKPSKAKGEGTKEYFRAPNFWNKYYMVGDPANVPHGQPVTTHITPQDIKETVESIGKYGGRGKKQVQIENGEAGTAMYHYTISLGQDEHGHYISYYDKFDLNHPVANKVGKPFEIYDRLYYDPKTYEVKPPDLTGLHLKEIHAWADKNLPAVKNARPR